MEDEERQPNMTGGHFLNWLLGLAILLVAGAIGWVGWNCIDRVQKHAGELKTLNVTAENTKVASHRYEMVKKEEDSEIMAGQLNPNLVIEETMLRLEGSEVLCSKGVREIDKKQFKEAELNFTKSLAMIPAEAQRKKVWQAGGHTVKRNAYAAFAYEQRSFCFLQEHKYKEAIADLSSAIKLRPGFALNYDNRAKAYLMIGEKARAAADIKEARSIPPPSVRDPYP